MPHELTKPLTPSLLSSHYSLAEPAPSQNWCIASPTSKYTQCSAVREGAGWEGAGWEEKTSRVYLGHKIHSYYISTLQWAVHWLKTLARSTSHSNYYTTSVLTHVKDCREIELGWATSLAFSINFDLSTGDHVHIMLRNFVHVDFSLLISFAGAGPEEDLQTRLLIL